MTDQKTPETEATPTDQTTGAASAPSARYTPGPWTVCGHELYYGPLAPGTRHQQIASAHDAQLMAAAPELLAALEALMRRAKLIPDAGYGIWRIESSIDGVIAQARDAINKATGECV